jgi:DNA primase
VFPIYRDKALLGFNTRDFTSRQTPKYLISKGLIKPLYNFDAKSETVILSEGIIKALRIAQVTNFNSAALLGHDLTDLQLEQIQASQCQHVILYPDLDMVGRRGALCIADKLSEHWNGSVSFVWPISGPADDVALPILKSDISNNRIPYSGITRCKILL